MRIYTDGACIGNPGAGGWAVIIVKDDGTTLKYRAGSKNTTNNRMELTAILMALKLSKEIDEATELFTDSQYCIGTLTQNWKIKCNYDLISKIKNELTNRRVQFTHVKGHNGHPENELCDFAAHSMAVQYDM